MLPAAIPGAIFGFLSLIGCFLILFWILWNYCPCLWCRCCNNACQWTCSCCWKKGKRPAAGAPTAPDQFIREDSLYETQTNVPLNTEITKKGVAANTQQVAVGDRGNFESSQREHKNQRRGRILQALTMFLGLSTIALSMWGIPETLVQTSNQIYTFWDILYDIRDASNNTTQQLTVLYGQLDTLQISVQQISNETRRIQTIVRRFGPVGETVADALDLIQQAASGIVTVQNATRDAIAALNRYVAGVSTVLPYKYIFFVSSSSIWCTLYIVLIPKPLLDSQCTNVFFRFFFVECYRG